MNLEYAKSRLEAWGDWARESATFGLGYPRCSPEHRLFFGQPSAQRFEPDNPDAEEIDGIVRLMGEQGRKIAAEHYIKSRSIVEIASRMRMNKKTLETRMGEMLGFVAGRLV